MSRVGDEFHFDVVGFAVGVGSESETLELFEIIDQLMIKVRISRKSQDPVVETPVRVDLQVYVDLFPGEIGLSRPSLEQVFDFG